MGVRIDLPTAGYLGAVQNSFVTITESGDLGVNTIYLLGGDVAYTLQLPQGSNSSGTNYDPDLAPGDRIIMKRVAPVLTGNTITIAANTGTIDGLTDNILINDGDTIATFVYVGSATVAQWILI